MRGHDIISAWPMTAAGDRDSEASRLKILMDGGEFQGRRIAGFKVSINLFLPMQSIGKIVNTMGSLSTSSWLVLAENI